MMVVFLGSNPLPPLREPQHIVEEVQRRLSMMDEIEATLAANLKRAERLRQAILKRACEGWLMPQNPVNEAGVGAVGADKRGAGRSADGAAGGVELIVNLLFWE